MVDVDCSDDVERGDQLGLDVPGEVSAVEETKIAQLEESGHAVGVV